MIYIQIYRLYVIKTCNFVLIKIKERNNVDSLGAENELSVLLLDRQDHHVLGYWRQERPLLATSRTSRYTYQSQLQGHVALFDRHCWKLRLLGHDETEKCFSRMDGIGFLRSESLEFRERVNPVL